MVVVFGHLVHEVFVGSSKVIHCRTILHCLLDKVGECLLYSDQVVGYIATLVQCLLVLSEIVLGFNEVVLEGRPVFGFFCPPLPKIFCMLSHIYNKSVCNADELGLCDRLSHLRCEIVTLVESLDEKFYYILLILAGMEIIAIIQHICGRDAGIIRVKVSDNLEVCLCGVSCICILECGQVCILEDIDKLVLD